MYPYPDTIPTWDKSIMKVLCRSLMLSWLQGFRVEGGAHQGQSIVRMRSMS